MPPRAQPGEDDEQQAQDAERLERVAPSKPDDARQPTAAAALSAGQSRARAMAAEPAGARDRGAPFGADSDGWSASPTTGRAGGVASSTSLKSRARAVPAVAKAQLAADDDDWGSNW